MPTLTRCYHTNARGFLRQTNFFHGLTGLGVYWSKYGIYISSLDDISNKIMIMIINQLSSIFSSHLSISPQKNTNKQAIIWEMSEKYSVVHRLTGHHHDIVGCQFSPDGALLVTASFDSRVCVWDPYTGECLQELQYV